MHWRQVIPALIAVAVGAPLFSLYVAAARAGEVRRREQPLRALLGDSTFEALRRGDRVNEHYLGDNRRMPEFALNDLQGVRWTSGEHQGKVLILNFWTQTCAPCLEELPTLEELAALLEGRDDVELVSISTDSDANAVRALLAPGSKLRVLLDPERSVVRDLFGTRLYPETWFVDTRGVIRLRVDGARDWSNAIVQDLIAQYN